ncbi:MAG: DMT family transporter [Actinobacteria bacterium]|nr:DMT family transporter [Actinomycetota bacterium]
MTVTDRRGVAFAVLAACTWSTAGILQEQLHVDLATQLAGRSLFAFLALALLALYGRSHLADDGRKPVDVSGSVGLLVTALTAMTSVAFIAALNETSVPNVLFFIATGPIMAALLGVYFLGQPIASRSVIASAIALLGIVTTIGAPSAGTWLGDALALVATVTFAGILVVCAKYPDVPMFRALCLAQVVIFAGSAPFADPATVSLEALGWMCLLGAGQLALGYAFFVAAARRLPVAEVAMISLLEMVLGPVWVWVGGTQSPTLGAIVGGLLVLLAVLVQILAPPPARQSISGPARRGEV